MSETPPAQFTIKDVAQFKKSLKAVEAFVTEVMMKVSNEEGIIIRAMDSSNACMLQLEIQKDAFTDLQVPQDEKVGFKLVVLNQALAKAKAGDTVTIVLSNPLEVRIEGKLKRKFNLEQLDLWDKEVRIPNLQKQDMIFEMTPDHLIEASSTAKYNQGSVFFTVNQENIVIGGCEDTPLRNWEMTIPFDEENKVLEHKKDVERVKYGQLFFGQVAKATFGEKVNVLIGNEYPIQITSESEGYKLFTILAPRTDVN